MVCLNHFPRETASEIACRCACDSFGFTIQTYSCPCMNLHMSLFTFVYLIFVSITRKIKFSPRGFCCCFLKSLDCRCFHSLGGCLPGSHQCSNSLLEGTKRRCHWRLSCGNPAAMLLLSAGWGGKRRRILVLINHDRGFWVGTLQMPGCDYRFNVSCFGRARWPWHKVIGRQEILWQDPQGSENRVIVGVGTGLGLVSDSATEHLCDPLGISPWLHLPGSCSQEKESLSL